MADNFPDIRLFIAALAEDLSGVEAFIGSQRWDTGEPVTRASLLEQLKRHIESRLIKVKEMERPDAYQVLEEEAGEYPTGRLSPVTYCRGCLGKAIPDNEFEVFPSHEAWEAATKSDPEAKFHGPSPVVCEKCDKVIGLT